MASPVALPPLSSSLSDVGSTSTKTRARSQTHNSNPPKRPMKESTAENLGFRVSKDKLLLVKARAPDYYIVMPSQIEMPEAFPCKVEIYCEMPQIEVSPRVLEFNEKAKSHEVTVFTRSIIGMNEVRLMHMLSK